MPKSERVVRLFRNGRNQAIRIPRDLDLAGEEAIVRKVGDRLFVEPVRKGKLLSLLATLPPWKNQFPTLTRTCRRLIP